MRYMRLLIGTLVTVGLLAALWVSPANADPPFDPPGLARAMAAQEAHTDALLQIQGVVGTATGFNKKDRLAVKVFVTGPNVSGIPEKLDGVPVEVVVTGKFVALHHRPGHSGGPGGTPDPEPGQVSIGASTGNAGECSAGTIGARLTDGTNVYALSNNHVYARENQATADPPGEGEKVVHPGLIDADDRCDPNSADVIVIGTLTDFEMIDFSTSASNTIDAAIALSSTAMLDNSTASDCYGTPNSSTANATLNQRVIKCGRTTRQTEGTVIGINATVDVGYFTGTARFVDQIIVISSNGPFISTTPFILPGDSGSLLVTQRGGKKPVGLLFAGTSDGIYAIANEIDQVLTQFGVTIDGK